MPVTPVTGTSDRGTFDETRQTATSNRSNALQRVEGAGTESRSRGSRMRGISTSSSTRSRYVIVFSTSRRPRTTCCRSVKPLRPAVLGLPAGGPQPSGTGCSRGTGTSSAPRQIRRSRVHRRLWRSGRRLDAPGRRPRLSPRSLKRTARPRSRRGVRRQPPGSLAFRSLAIDDTRAHLQVGRGEHAHR